MMNRKKKLQTKSAYHNRIYIASCYAQRSFVIASVVLGQCCTHDTNLITDSAEKHDVPIRALPSEPCQSPRVWRGPQRQAKHCQLWYRHALSPFCGGTRLLRECPERCASIYRISKNVQEMSYFELMLSFGPFTPVWATGEKRCIGVYNRQQFCQACFTKLQDQPTIWTAPKY